MKILRLGALAQLFCFTCVAMDSVAADIVISYSEPLSQLSFTTRSGGPDSQKPATDRVTSMQFDAFGRRFDIRLEENRALTTAAHRFQVGATVGAYRGEISGNADSWVRLTIVDDVPSGLLWDGQEAFAIDIVDDETAIYRLADLHIEPGALSCSQADSVGSGNDLLKLVVSEVSATTAKTKTSGPGAVSEISLAVISDFEFASIKGDTVEADVIRRMNNVDGMFSAQLGVQLTVNQLDVYTTPNDPFGEESNPGQLLDDLADYRFSNSEQHTNGLSHLLTGRILEGSTVGIAFGGGTGSALCSRRFGAGVTEATHSAAIDSLIIAHELGHNFGAPHDGTTDSACEATAQDFLMAPSINGSDMFSACSIAQMQDDVNQAACISPLPIGDITVEAAEAVLTVLQGNSATIVYELNNRGTEAVDSAELSVSIPDNVTVESVTGGSGSCTTGAGNAVCTFGTLAAGSGETVTVSTATPQVGTADFVATASADNDANAVNNQATVQLTIDPAVELVVDVTANEAQIVPNATTTLQSTVENRAVLAASNVTITITVDDGIEIDSVSWDSGSCEINATVVTCMAPALDAQSSSNLTVQVTGVNEGLQNYSVSISSAEADRDMSNNDVAGQLNVTTASSSPGPAPATAADSGGGGSAGFMLLVGLFWVNFVARARGAIP